MQTKHFFIIFCLFFTSAGFAQNKLFEKYADMDDVTSVYISKAMFQMMPKIESIGINLVNMTGKIESLQLVKTEKKDKIVQMKKYFSQLVTNHHQEVMRIKDDEKRINFYSIMQGDLIKELIMLVENKDSFIAILLVGNFALKDIQEIVGQL